MAPPLYGNTQSLKGAEDPGLPGLGSHQRSANPFIGCCYLVRHTTIGMLEGTRQLRMSYARFKG